MSTAPGLTSPAEQDTAAGTEPSGRRRRRVPTWARWVVVVVLAAVVIGVLTVATSGPPVNQTPGDPENRTGTGTAALLAVAREQGIDVEVVRGQEALDAVGIDADTTVVVSGTQALGERTGPTLLTQTADAAGLVLLAPDQRLLETLRLPADAGPGPDPAGTQVEAVPAACDLRVGRQDPALRLAPTFVYSSATEGAASCFTVPAPADDDDPDTPPVATLLTLPATDERPAVTLFGAEQILTGDVVVSDDNAGIALRLLFPTERTVWYVPDPTDDLTAARSVGDALPEATGPAVWLVGIAVLALALVQGRRLGPLVRESLPVVVPSTETTLHRARLYRQARDPARALASLRAGTRRRLAEHLSLGAHAREEHVLEAVAARTGHSIADLRGLLTEPVAADDSTLVSIARQLAELEKEVHPR